MIDVDGAMPSLSWAARTAGRVQYTSLQTSSPPAVKKLASGSRLPDPVIVTLAG
jgi:hypothetical protein